MIELSKPKKAATSNHHRYKKVACIGRVSMEIINEISVPIDAVNRFLNLTLQTVDESSHSREFLLESKAAIRKTSVLLKRLNNYAKKLEKEIREISENEQDRYPGPERR